VTNGATQRLERILDGHREFRSHVVPLCAAETPISDFVRSFLLHPIHESYAMGGPTAPAANNFIGAEHVLALHQLVIDLCREIFGAAYADPRPLSGTAAATNLLMTLSEPGQRIMLQTPASGGHPSMGPICKRLGLDVVDMPYDYERFQPTKSQPDDGGSPVDFVLCAPSDIIYPPDLTSLGVSDETVVIHDATQTLGLIASGHHPSPFLQHPRVVISAGTHKTLPGPSSGLLLTLDAGISARLDTELSPKFVRHSHPHHIAALCATLIEQQAIGMRYSSRIIRWSTILSGYLEDRGLRILQDGDKRSQTHQVFIHVPEHRLDRALQRAMGSGVTLNAKRKRLFRDSGLRIGVQEIARYCWSETELERLAEILADIVSGETSLDILRHGVRELAEHNVFAEDMQLPAHIREDLVR
jgi:glycine/serine hydroxymethyltransferase